MGKYDKYINSTGTHYISNCGSDEYGGISGGKAGDQTGTEWRLMNWYSRPWDCVLRHPDQKVGQKLAELACAAALNDKIGYDQYERDGYWNELVKVGYDPEKISMACETDCSAGVIANIKAVGHLFGIVALQNISCTYTGNMRTALKEAGFKVLTAKKYTAGSQYLLPGDILLNDAVHTATNVTAGSKSGYTATADEPEPEQQKSASAAAVNASGSASLGPDSKTSGVYVVNAKNGVNLRSAAGVEDSHKILTVLKLGTLAYCYGYYSMIGSQKWLYVQAVVNGVVYTGHVHAKWLTRRGDV